MKIEIRCQKPAVRITIWRLLSTRLQRLWRSHCGQVVIFSLLSVVCRLSSALEPATLSITSLREESVANASESDFYSGAPLLLTNCIAYSGTTTNSARQNLANLAIIIKLGAATNNIAYTGTVANATSGTWWARIDAVPSNWDSPKLFLKLTNATDAFGYPFKILKVKTPL